MTTAESLFTRLSEADRERLESWLVEFDLSWSPDRLRAQTRDLPAEGLLRLAALVEMTKIDLERQWQHGRRVTVEDYLRDFPELADADGPPGDLVRAEWEARGRAGETPDPGQFRLRFPGRSEAIRDLPPQSGTAGTPPPGSSVEQTEVGSSMSPPGDIPDRIGRYRVVRRLGHGGMGSVYLGHDDELDRPVAVKVPHFAAEDGSDVRERFRREARAAAALDHPNLCRVHDVGEWHGGPFLTMAYIEGRPLAELTADGPLPGDRAVELVRKVAEAVAYAHSRGVVHRDLKPSNILIDARGEPVVTDFGLALRAEAGDERLTQAGTPLGTPAYMSPEQIAGDPGAVGPATDVFSLGVILYELLAGRPPFRGRGLEVMGRITLEAPPPPSAHRPGIDPWLDDLCLKVLEKDSTRRLSMAEFADAIAGRAPDAERRSRALLLAAVALLVVAAVVYFAVRDWRGPEPKPEPEPGGGGGGAVEGQRDEQPPVVPKKVTPKPVEWVAGEPTVLKGHAKGVMSVGFAADGKSVLSASADQTVRRWDPDTGKEAADARMTFENQDVLIISPDGRRVLTRFLTTDLHDLETRQQLLTYPTPGHPHIKTLAFAGNGRRVGIGRMAIGGQVSAVVWDLETDQKHVFARHPDLKEIELVALSADGKLGVSVDEEAVLRVWEVESGTEVRQSKGVRPTTLAFTPDAAAVLTGDGLGNLVLRDTKTGKEVGRFEGHTNRITSVAFSRDGRVLLSGSLDGSARVWDVAKQKEVLKLDGHTKGVTCVVLSADGRRAVTGGMDGAVRFWHLTGGGNEP
jgi:predicted Ser/Thr protein kinase